MTDAEILQSHFDHVHLRHEIEELVREGTPTRIGRMLPRARRSLPVLVYDYALERYVEVPSGRR